MERGGRYYNHGLKQIFPYRFLAVSFPKFIKEKLKKIEGPLTLEDRQTKSGAARAFNFFLK